MAWRYEHLLSHAPAPLIVDLGYGATPTTTIELAERLLPLNAELHVTGLEIDPQRVHAAQSAGTQRVDFALGGFEIPTSRSPVLIRAFNVLRQYAEGEVEAAWALMQQRLASGGHIVEGTCDEPGRIAAWVELDSQRPLSLTLAAATQYLHRISDIAPRLPKILIHRNVDGEAIHRFLRDADAAWASHAPLRIFGARQRWAATVRSLRGSWPIHTPRSRENHGEITIDWSSLTA
jgi:hypothetical protein